MLAVIPATLAVRHLDAPQADSLHDVTVEVHVGTGLPGFDIVGLGSEIVRSMRDRLRAAFMAEGLDWPMRRITVCVPGAPLLPRSRTVWSSLDLAVALGILAAAEKAAIPTIRTPVGELALNGVVRTGPLTGTTLGNLAGWLASFLPVAEAV